MSRLHKQMTIAAAGLLTAMLIPATAFASVDSSTGAVPTMPAVTAAGTEADVPPDTELTIETATAADLRELGIKSLPSACTPSDDEPYKFTNGAGERIGMTCYEAKGDDQWVLDTLSDGQRFHAYVETEYGKKRWCGDSTSGWTECKYDHKEHECVIFAGYYAGDLGGYVDWTPWVSTTTGDPGCKHD